jgi:hypothetical protein
MKSLSVRPLILCVQAPPNFSPGKEDVWVVPLFLHKLAYVIYELERFAKVGKLEFLNSRKGLS